MSAQSNKVILRFDNVTYAYPEAKRNILEWSSFTLRENSKITIMGQNGAGKSTLFKLIMEEIQPQEWAIHKDGNSSIAIARQVIPREHKDLTLREFFETWFDEKDYAIDKKINEVLWVVNLSVKDYEKQIKDFSGWQQARILLAHALIQKPDILLLDEPTNNLDADGIGDLITFLLTYDKTVVVISHDADFLNMFTDGVLYLNVMRSQVEQYWWDYYDVVDQIAAQIEKEKMNNARAEKKITDAKAKINEFSNKGWKMRKLAKKMKDEVEEAEDNKVEVRKEDKTIKRFKITCDNYIGPLVTINGVSLMNKEHELEHFDLALTIKKKERYLLKWPNGIGKSTLLKRLFSAHDNDATIHDDVVIWYYSQDFDALDMDMTVRDSLESVTNEATDQDIYRVASQFLLTWDLLKNSVIYLSEWQKGLLCYARFVLQRPHLLIMDEPTNHINFRHLPVIAEALSQYEWAMIMVSHDQGFLSELKEVQTVDLGKLMK